MEPPRPEQVRRELSDMGVVLGLVVAVFLVAMLFASMVNSAGLNAALVPAGPTGPFF